MKRIIFFLFSAWLLTTNVIVFGQTLKPIRKIDKSKIKNERRNFSLNDSISSGSNRTKKINLSAKTTYTDYKVFSFLKETTYIDTTLNIKKHYKFNFLRKDNFGLLPFHNIGQTFNRLTYDFDKLNPVPNIGFTAKQFSFNTIDNINYFEVPTPTSEIMFLTTLEQGRFLDSFFTLNFSKRLNVSIAYTGLRSLGKYRAALVSQGNFRTTFHYETKKGQYKIRGHIATQDILHEESGGLTPEALRAFIDDDPNFSDRARLDVNLEDTENFLEASRVYLEQEYQLLTSKDSANQKDFTNLKIGHVLESSREAYEFRQGSPTSFIGTTNFSGTIRSNKRHHQKKTQRECCFFWSRLESKN
jgi:hypothetical protein